ncbi:MAG: hypothetical protein ABI895_02030 [Deltaproteobacteria bacterium]
MAAWVLACGGAEREGELFQPAEEPGEVKDVPPEVTTEPLVAVPPIQLGPLEVGPTPPTETTPTEMLVTPPAQTSGCKPANGVSGSPTTISEAIILINTLPRPTTLACFLQALDRPLSLYLTKSVSSLQPAIGGARSPRTFVLRDNFEMSIVFEGNANNTLEFGFRPEQARSIKAEVAFPVTRDVSEMSLFERVQVTPRTTECGRCHVGEEHIDYPGFPLGVFISDAIGPLAFEEVSVESMQAENASCDETAEPYRCELLSALFDHGEVVRGVLKDPR